MLRLAQAGLTVPAVASRGLSEGLGLTVVRASMALRCAGSGCKGSSSLAVLRKSAAPVKIRQSAVRFAAAGGQLAHTSVLILDELARKSAFDETILHGSQYVVGARPYVAVVGVALHGLDEHFCVINIVADQKDFEFFALRELDVVTASKIQPISEFDIEASERGISNALCEYLQWLGAGDVEVHSCEA